MTNLSTAEKTLKVKEAMAQKKFSSVEAACKVFKLSSASYYNYAKKIGKDKNGNGHLPQKPTTAEKWIDEVQALKLENAALKTRIQADNQVIQKLKNKVLDFVLLQ